MTDTETPPEETTDTETTTAAGGTDTIGDDTAAADRRAHVRKEYGDVAASAGDCCGSSTGDGEETAIETDTAVEADPARASDLGYDPDDLSEAPDGSNLGLGCGNPVAISRLEAGETVLDLGSGGGFDCFLAAREVGADGQVIGVDMTAEMIERARENARESEFDTVDFRLGEIEHLPVADATVDAIISNCVINLSPDKPQVLAEAFRVLEPGGRLSVSDLLATEELPREIRDNPDAVAECVGGATTVERFERLLAETGFVDVSITEAGQWSEELPIVSARIEARKPE
ncbi:methyltransferase domain-containing protein [Salinadaptatus halalkaliphilus]|uniref:Arsenite methyltransferase n=1 Tax=Salinadaptatus halalkaliphilus TaxID=2419781 RepID=A0A4V3VL10_9EURY|nr:arsenite methyltransferase [Salinadaptatus halalkaliphilus]THE63767.1 methyltransferase domain-containing protein [Salinadaptatus halalkaliphilus]